MYYIFRGSLNTSVLSRWNAWEVIFMCVVAGAVNRPCRCCDQHFTPHWSSRSLCPPCNDALTNQDLTLSHVLKYSNNSSPVINKPQPASLFLTIAFCFVPGHTYASLRNIWLSRNRVLQLIVQALMLLLLAFDEDKASRPLGYTTWWLYSMLSSIRQIS